MCLLFVCFEINYLCVFPFVFVLESLVLLDSRFFLIRCFALKLCSGRTLLAAYGLQAASQKPLRLHRKGAKAGRVFVSRLGKTRQQRVMAQAVWSVTSL